MIENPKCPVCQGDDWIQIGHRTYARDEIDHMSAHVRDRYRVVFEIWCPNLEELTVRSEICRICGFALFKPRPSAEDIDRKYRFLQSIGSNRPLTPYDSGREKFRAHRLYQIVSRYVANVSSARVLDFGGSDGRLMQGFLARRATCHLIDYCETPIPGVVRIGATEDDISEDNPYDVIVCSHVLEHLADPLRVVQQLARRLRKGGILYAEVPMEIWKRPPLPREPVTHINFFTPTSMTYLMGRGGGLSVRSCRLAGYLPPSGGSALVIGCIAEKNAHTQLPLPGVGFAETQRFLTPDAYLTMRRMALVPDTVIKAAIRRLRRTIA